MSPPGHKQRRRDSVSIGATEGTPMDLPRRQLLQLATGAAALSTTSRIAWAQTYPTRPITIIVPFGAGSSIDTFTRIVGERMRLVLGQPVITENVAGAGGSIGVGRAARGSGDGYTLVIGGSNTHVVNSVIYTLQYDTLNDFEPISLLTTFPLLIVAKKSMPAANLRELIAWLKANPNKASAGTPGAGTPQHVAGIYFQNLTGTRFQFVPYRTGLIQGLVAEQIDLIFDVADNSLPLVRAGNIRAYAVTAKTRVAVAPDIATVDEAGLPEFHV